MSIGLIGKKVGMTRIFDEKGDSIPVTVIDVSDNIFLQKKTEESDGYSAIQIGFDDQKESRLNQPELGHIKKHGGTAKKLIKEFRVEDDKALPEGAHPGMEVFKEGQYVDVIGTSKGKGFQGVMKRWGFHGQPMSHGSMMHRRTGAIAPGTTPGRVWKLKEMPGHHGTYKKTIQNLHIVKVRPEDKVILVSGAVPGAKGGYLIIRPAVKKEAGEIYVAPKAKLDPKDVKKSNKK